MTFHGFPGHVHLAEFCDRNDLPTDPTIVRSYGVVLLAAGVVRKLVPEHATP